MDRVDPAKSETAAQKTPARGPHIRRVITPQPTHRTPAAGSPSRARPAHEWVAASRSLSTSSVLRAKSQGLTENCYRTLGGPWPRSSADHSLRNELCCRHRFGTHQHTYLAAEQVEQNGYAVAIGHALIEAETVGEHTLENTNFVPGAKRT